MSGPNPLGVPERRVGRAFLGQLVFRSFPFEALRSGRLARGAGPGPKVPTLETLLSVCYDKKKKRFVSSFESSKRHFEFFFFFEKYLKSVFFLKKHTLSKFLNIPKIPTRLFLNIYLFSLKHLFILFKKIRIISYYFKN